MKKVVVVMTYFNRPYQFVKTLKSIAETEHEDVEIVVVDDQSTQPPQYAISDMPLHMLRTEGKCWTNPEPAYNTGLLKALEVGADVVILQNAECYHVGDVVSRAAMVAQHEYLSFSCFSLDKETTFATHDIKALTATCETGASKDGQLAWYNHPVYRPVGYDFCGAITADNIKRLNGYDERFSSGCGFGDDYLLWRIKKMGLRVHIPLRPFVVHQWHYSNGVPENKLALVRRNNLLLDELVQQENYRAKHLFTKDLDG